MILTNDYTKYFVVLDKDEIDKNNNSFQDIITIDQPVSVIMKPAR